MDPNGVITAFGLAPASSDERPIGDALVAGDRHEAYLADKGFTGVQWERRLLEVSKTFALPRSYAALRSSVQTRGLRDQAYTIRRKSPTGDSHLSVILPI